MSRESYERASRIGPAMKKLRLMPATPNYEFLATIPARFVPKYAYRSENWERGEFFRVGNDKYLVQNDGRIDAGEPPPVNPLCKLFRDESGYGPDGSMRLWVREEFCVKGTERYYDGGDPQRTGWYIVISDRVDSATPPPNDAQNWEKRQEAE